MHHPVAGAKRMRCRPLVITDSWHGYFVPVMKRAEGHCGLGHAFCLAGLLKSCLQSDLLSDLKRNAGAREGMQIASKDSAGVLNV